MKTLKYTITGELPLLLNNPQCVDPLNEYSKLKKPLTSKRVKTDDDHADLADLDIRAKIYWNDELGIYVPSTWVMAALGKVSHGICKVSKASIRGGIFMNEPKLKLVYEGMKTVKEPVDVVKNPIFRHKMLLPQGQVRLAKVFPIFHKWSFEGTLDYDESVTTGRDLKLMFEKAAHYNGFGDFRPTFGRASVTIEDI
jgi:hypothetical protein